VLAAQPLHSTLSVAVLQLLAAALGYSAHMLVQDNLPLC
jgi:hypothetical protein